MFATSCVHCGVWLCVVMSWNGSKNAGYEGSPLAASDRLMAAIQSLGCWQRGVEGPVVAGARELEAVRRVALVHARQVVADEHAVVARRREGDPEEAIAPVRLHERRPSRPRVRELLGGGGRRAVGVLQVDRVRARRVRHQHQSRRRVREAVVRAGDLRGRSRASVDRGRRSCRSARGRRRRTARRASSSGSSCSRPWTARNGAGVPNCPLPVYGIV